MRTHYCGLVTEAMIGQAVTVCGWADVARNLGGVCFIDLRDHEGSVQVVAEGDAARPETPGEDVRLKYRYLDLRNPVMQKRMRKRIALVQALRRHLDAAGFQDIETPILTKATPEGARDYLVPSRVHAGE